MCIYDIGTEFLAYLPSLKNVSSRIHSLPFLLHSFIGLRVCFCVVVLLYCCEEFVTQVVFYTLR
jgi:hypothetical protein